MRLLILDAYFEPESTAYTYIERDILQSVTENGDEVFVICPTPTRGINAEVRRVYKKRFKEDSFEGKLHIRRFSAPQERKNPLIRFLRYIICNLKTLKLSSEYQISDAVFSNSTPPTQGLTAAMVSKRLAKRSGKKIPFIYNLQDIFPDSLVNTRMTHTGSLIWKIGRKIEDYTYKHADKIIVISEDFKKNIMEKGVPEEKIAVVPNWADTKGIYPIERKDNVLIERYSLNPDKFYISYSGNIGYTQNMDLLLDAAKEIKDSMPLVCFLLIGEGAVKDAVQKRIETEKIDNVIMIPFQPYEEIAHVFSIGDAGLIISKEGVGSNSVPSKTWGYMAAEKPIIASFDTDSELCRLIDSTGCGVTAKAGDIKCLIEAVKQIIIADTVTMGKKGKECIETTYNRDKCVKQYIDVINEQLGQV